MFGEKVKPNPALVTYWVKLGDQWDQMGRVNEATRYYQKALEMSQKVFGPTHQTTKALNARIGGLSHL
ncbi:MAG: hypothetical protein A2600_00095 [Candidatus Lambdaproteobacteria bacterium RIFOXYD1_FULL_56_27]|uniref:Uncharacterized protein n=1 Tax=Candidatus Lambdaproteobacteria bacterium RIFOXYD2_FULL_56_26 TaxID=1817773 RepID=A0A1F6GPX1_9PROT|nr:MAG: hypothetical protein A2557_04215 [Candidatus Lambdaproteobacteria bacterium RIFOXYD2_FULL_56_26]OGH03919.1 MAG: hypothetical protein A2426_07440 [Candidatus Lambdaproteobacteria bacterium RIFOXYC1_FULL_56_13]OGH06176.1 MAG: hypothetical protein A2600_00095 [Candidatus Lambdaproteobacteria bacterium RIFOXYD1_FULL_56_27]